MPIDEQTKKYKPLYDFAEDAKQPTSDQRRRISGKKVQEQFNDLGAITDLAQLSDGSRPWVGDVNANNHKLTNLADPTEELDVVNLRYLNNAVGRTDTAIKNLLFPLTNFVVNNFYFKYALPDPYSGMHLAGVGADDGPSKHSLCSMGDATYDNLSLLPLKDGYGQDCTGNPRIYPTNKEDIPDPGLPGSVAVWRLPHLSNSMGVDASSHYPVRFKIRPFMFLTGNYEASQVRFEIIEAAYVNDGDPTQPGATIDLTFDSRKVRGASDNYAGHGEQNTPSGKGAFVSADISLAVGYGDVLATKGFWIKVTPLTISGCDCCTTDALQIFGINKTLA